MTDHVETKITVDDLLARRYCLLVKHSYFLFVDYEYIKVDPIQQNKTQNVSGIAAGELGMLPNAPHIYPVQHLWDVLDKQIDPWKLHYAA